MEAFHFPHLPGPTSCAYFALFRNVENAAELRRRIIAASTLSGPSGVREREAVNFAFVEAKLMTSREHLHAAVHQALLAESQGALRTKYVHSEVLFGLNGGNNITESIRRYGISDTSKDVIVVRIGESGIPFSNIQELMKDVVIGSIVPFTELDNIVDWASVKKYHKLNGEPALRGLTPADEKRAIKRIVASSVAMKSVAQ